jgi:CO/xanthine dehydrogenase Mo-binding subunit
VSHENENRPGQRRLYSGCRFDNTLDGGAYAGWGIVVMFYTASMIHLPYKVPNARARGRRVYTNKPTCGAMRGLGGVQPRFAMECMLDEMAEMIGISPYELKMKNAVESGYRSVSNLYVPHTEYKKCLQTAVEKSGYLEKHGKLPFGKGIGLAGGYYITGTAYTLYQAYKPHTTALIRVDTEGGVTVHCALPISARAAIPPWLRWLPRRWGSILKMCTSLRVILNWGLLTWAALPAG